MEGVDGILGVDFIRKMTLDNNATQVNFLKQFLFLLVFQKKKNQNLI